ncbi:hypothetical protein UT300003_25250 [Clostridium sardiniense]
MLKRKRHFKFIIKAILLIILFIFMNIFFDSYSSLFVLGLGILVVYVLVKCDKMEI